VGKDPIEIARFGAFEATIGLGTSNENLRTKLLVVITPRVVQNPDQARAVTEELRQRLRGLAPLSIKVR